MRACPAHCRDAAAVRELLLMRDRSGNCSTVVVRGGRGRPGPDQGARHCEQRDGRVPEWAAPVAAMELPVDLFSPVTLGGIELANRVVMAPLTRMRSGASGVPG